jgi:hypothetical protein
MQVALNFLSLADQVCHFTPMVRLSINNWIFRKMHVFCLNQFVVLLAFFCTETDSLFWPVGSQLGVSTQPLALEIRVYHLQEKPFIQKMGETASRFEELPLQGQVF